MSRAASSSKGAPESAPPADVGPAIAAHSGVVETHDLHVWTVTDGFPALSAHVLVQPGADCHRIRLELETMLHDRFGIDHTTLQVEHVGSARGLEISRSGLARRPASLTAVTGLFAVIQVLLSAALIGLVLMHSGRDTGFGGMGFTPASQGGQHIVERNLTRLTVFVALLFAINTVVLFYQFD